MYLNLIVKNIQNLITDIRTKCDKINNQLIESMKEKDELDYKVMEMERILNDLNQNSKLLEKNNAYTSQESVLISYEYKRMFLQQSFMDTEIPAIKNEIEKVRFIYLY